MKKIYLLIFTILFSINVYASETLNEISIEYQNNLITQANRNYENRYIFQIEYTPTISNLTEEQLNYILTQESNDYLKVFGEIKVKVNPYGIYRNLKNDIIVGYSGGIFGNNLYENVLPNDIASKQNLSFVIKNPILEIYYRKNENEAWTNNKNNLSGNLKIQEQLEQLLNIESSQVKEKYNKLYYFKPYTDVVYTNRLDFYETTNKTIKEDNNYETNTLKKLNHEYAVLKFDTLTTNVFLEQNPKNNIQYVVITSIIICIATFYIFKRKKLI